MGSLAVLRESQKRYDEAEQFHLQQLQIRKRGLGAENPATLGTITNLGSLYHRWGRYDDARKMFETSLPAKRRVLGMQHRWTQIAMDGLANAYVALGRDADASPLQRELLELRAGAAGKQ